MLLLVAGAVVAGALLALRFTALILIPVVLLGTTLMMVVGVTIGTDIWMVCLQTVSVAVSVQVGYLAGACIRFGCWFKSRARGQELTGPPLPQKQHQLAR